MAAGPQRRPLPARHLGAHIVPVELALKERAAHVSPSAFRDAAKAFGMDDDQAYAMGAFMAHVVEGEFRALADELHYW
ncbi:MAG TPA: hypothetical protein VGS19_23875 [Streptosporangiaceae bacterium]|nr:hypothetical protein [Streptosporangiaceae bacterium]